MAWSLPIWKIFGFPKVSLYLERFVLKHATAHIQERYTVFFLLSLVTKTYICHLGLTIHNGKCESENPFKIKK
jgi:hypothetical protein